MVSRYRRYNKRYSKYKKRYRRYRKRYNRYKKRYRRKLPITGFPRSMLAKLRYSSAIELTVESNQLTAFRRFRANDIYDPDWSVGGGQPMGRDEYAGIYRKYMVVGSKITVKYMCHSENTTPYKGFVIGVNLTDETSLDYFSDVKRYIEAGRCRYNVEATHTAGTGILPKMLTRKFSAKKFFKVANPLDNIDDLGALFTEGPDKPAFYDIFASFLTGPHGTTIRCCTALVTIDYLVLMVDPYLLLRS